MEIILKDATGNKGIVFNLNDSTLELFSTSHDNKTQIDENIETVINDTIPNLTAASLSILILDIYRKLIYSGLSYTINSRMVSVTEPSLTQLHDTVVSTHTVYQLTDYRRRLWDNITNLDTIVPGEYDISLSPNAQKVTLAIKFKESLVIDAGGFYFLWEDRYRKIWSDNGRHSSEFTLTDHDGHVTPEEGVDNPKPFLVKELSTGNIREYRTLDGPMTLMDITDVDIAEMIQASFDEQYKFNTEFVIGASRDLLDRYVPPSPVHTVFTVVDSSLYFSMIHHICNPLMRTIANSILADILYSYPIVEPETLLDVLELLISDFSNLKGNDITPNKYKTTYKDRVEVRNGNRIKLFNRLRQASLLAGKSFDPNQVAGITSLTPLDKR